jgi:hypothetical protein
VATASKEIKTGQMVTLNLPLNVPKVPAFAREEFKHEIKVLHEGVAYDDKYQLNTQSGTQLDGFRHIAHLPTQTFYNGQIPFLLHRFARLYLTSYRYQGKGYSRTRARPTQVWYTSLGPTWYCRPRNFDRLLDLCERERGRLR